MKAMSEGIPRSIQKYVTRVTERYQRTDSSKNDEWKVMYAMVSRLLVDNHTIVSGAYLEFSQRNDEIGPQKVFR